MRNFLKILSINKESCVPLYRQIFASIKQGIEDGMISQGDVMPSINDLCVALDISKNTSEKAYSVLKEKGFLGSIPGKGYYIKTPYTHQRKKILLLFNKISTHKKIIYDAFISRIRNFATVDLCVYNNDLQELQELITEKLQSYHTFVIIPPVVKNDEPIYEIIKSIGPEQLYILDRHLQYENLCKGTVYQDFEKDIYYALDSLLERIKKYESLKIVFPDSSGHTVEILNGFRKFCKKNMLCYSTIKEVKKEEIKSGTIYISLMEEDLVILIDKIQESGLQPGVNVGLISYNETPFKRMLLNGLTTISTDFQQMGELMADLILQDSSRHLPVPFHVICRNSV